MSPVDVSIVIPAYNEAAILRRSVADVVDGLRARGVSFEVVLAENGSTDGTSELADELAVDHPEVRVEHLADPDYGRALRAGLLAATGTVVVNFDADYYDLGFLDEAVARVSAEDGPAIVVGSKRAKGAHDARSTLRKLVTWTFATMLRAGFGLRVSDTHGIKAMRRQTVEPLARRCRFGHDIFDTELILRAERAGLRTGEVPVSVVEMRPARSSILRRVPRTIVALARLRLALWRERSSRHAARGVCGRDVRA